MRERILIRNADAVVTCDPADRVLYNSDILICGGRIEAVGSNLAAGDAQIIDAAGLVNTHHHFFQAFVRNLMTIDRPGLTLMQWLDDIYKVFVRIDGDVIFYASAACMADLIKHGCTCSVDHQYCYTPSTGKQGPHAVSRHRKERFSVRKLLIQQFAQLRHGDLPDLHPGDHTPGPQRRRPYAHPFVRGGKQQHGAPLRRPLPGMVPPYRLCRQ